MEYINTFGIFEGGGTKGLAHIGALKATEHKRIKFLGIAGTSAGSIVAALVAVGYNADELYKLDEPTTLPTDDSHTFLQQRETLPFENDFIDEFFGKQDWNKFERLKEDASKTFNNSNPLKIYLNAPGFYWRNRDLLNIIFYQKGIFSTEKFMNWLEALLAKKVIHKSGTNDTVLFQDINPDVAPDKIPLKIIATDLSNNKIKIYGQNETPTVRVAEAVAASISIPFFFQPKQIKVQNDQMIELVDGGLLSNFPAWVFDEERRKQQVDIFTPMFAFKLVERKRNNTQQPRLRKDNQTTKTPDIFSFANRIFSTTLSGDEVLETREVANLNIIPLYVNVGTFDFNLNSEQKENLYKDGQRSAENFFRSYKAPPARERMETILKILHALFLKELENNDSHLRVHIMMRTAEDKLKVVYTYNFDPDDADDRLELDLASGVCGLCWKNREIIYGDFEQIKLNMDKYQKALVRPPLKSMLSVPIFDPIETEGSLLGVLSYDSDNDLIKDFSKDTIQLLAQNSAVIVSTSF